MRRNPERQLCEMEVAHPTLITKWECDMKQKSGHNSAVSQANAIRPVRNQPGDSCEGTLPPTEWPSIEYDIRGTHQRRYK
jgi:hypothetical protein